MPVPLQVLLGFVVVVLAVLLGLRRRPRPVSPPSADLVERLRILLAGPRGGLRVERAGRAGPRRERRDRAGGR